MDEGGRLFFSEVFFLFSKNFIKSTTAAIVSLSRMIYFISFQSKNLYSILFYVQVEDLKVFIKV
jgi:phage terminase large subunit-like protein